MSNNPLIDYPELPPFSKIQPEHVLPAVEQLVADGRARIQQVLAEGKFDYAHLVQALRQVRRCAPRVGVPEAQTEASERAGERRKWDSAVA